MAHGRILEGMSGAGRGKRGGGEKGGRGGQAEMEQGRRNGDSGGILMTRHCLGS